VKPAAVCVLAVGPTGLPDHAFSSDAAAIVTRNLHRVARRRVVGKAGPVAWVVVALLAGGAVLALHERDVGLWLVAMGGGLATFVAMAGLVVSRATEETDRVVAEHALGGWAAVQAELARSRRHDRRFAIVGIPQRIWSRLAQSEETNAPGFHVADSVQSLVRRPDRAWVDGPIVHVLLTDCDRRQGRAFIERAGIAMPQLFDGDRVKLVVFPDDGVTLGALVARLHDGAPEPSPTTVRE
jgi:hypothetical protein